MAKESYDHADIEKKAQEKWASLDLYNTDLTDTEKEPYYLLVEFPYPSGDLHIGHWYAFAVPDIYARFLRMQGKNVLYPFGFDAFGLPAENAAIRNKFDPKEWTYKTWSECARRWHRWAPLLIGQKKSSHATPHTTNGRSGFLLNSLSRDEQNDAWRR